MVQKAERVLAPRNRGGARGGRPVGNVTRGTTNPNRMRRVDRWLTGAQVRRWRAAAHPLAVDLGYGASPATAVELFERLAAVRADMRVVGIEIEPERVRQAKPLEQPGLSFQLGGFELPVAGEPVLVRAFNVLRQYEEADVPGIWRLVQDRLAPGGLFIDGTCDEIGRRAAWVALDAERPLSLSISMRFGSFTLPSDVAERLPKALIHRNVPGREGPRLPAGDGPGLAGGGATGVVRKPAALVGDVPGPARRRLAGQDGPSRWRLGEVTVGWEAVAPGQLGLLPGDSGPGTGGRSPGAVRAHVAAAATAGVLDRGAHVGEVHGRGRHGRQPENAERARAAAAAQLREQGEQAHRERTAGQGQPEGLGPLAIRPRTRWPCAGGSRKTPMPPGQRPRPPGPSRSRIRHRK